MLNNLKQTGMALIQYTNDHDGIFPQWRDPSNPYAVGGYPVIQQWHCIMGINYWAVRKPRRSIGDRTTF